MSTTHKEQLLVDGYFRQAQLLLPSFRIIPISLMQICYTYFHSVMWYYKAENQVCWTPYNYRDQLFLNDAINDNQTSCVVHNGQKIVEFHDQNQGKQRNLFNEHYPTYPIDVINGSPDKYAACVIDNGSGFMKAGFAGEQIPPLAVFPSIVSNDYSIGHSAETHSDELQLKHPMQNGIITNWDQMEAIWYHAICNELCIVPEDHAILLTETTLNPKRIRRKMTQIMFETFNVAGLSITPKALLSLYSQGKTTGIVLQSGYGATQCVPIYESYVLPHGVNTSNIGGNELSHFLGGMLKEKIPNKMVNLIKEKVCYVGMDCEAAEIIDYRLPDGSVISIGSERYTCSEVLFKPDLIGNQVDYNAHETLGMDQMIYRSLTSCDVDFRKELCNNTVLSGGNTMFKGIEQRLEKELRLLVYNRYREHEHNIIASPTRQYSAWEGGSMLASLSSFNEQCITKEEYWENGPCIVQTKCI
eukprot:367252_1